MNYLIKWPKGLRQMKTKWETIRPEKNEIRATFNPEAYLDYLRAIRTQPETFKTIKNG